jgi:hypothetical protein
MFILPAQATKGGLDTASNPARVNHSSVRSAPTVQDPTAQWRPRTSARRRGPAARPGPAYVATRHSQAIYFHLFIYSFFCLRTAAAVGLRRNKTWTESINSSRSRHRPQPDTQTSEVGFRSNLRPPQVQSHLNSVAITAALVGVVRRSSYRGRFRSA